MNRAASDRTGSEARYVEPCSAFGEVGGQSVHYTREGRGVLLVLLHGSGASLPIFGDVVPRLRDRFEVIRVDLPGFGLTGSQPERDYTIAAYVRFLRRFLATHVTADVGGPPILVGYSFGGQITWTFALDHPDELRALVLLNATGYPDKDAPLALKLARNPLTRPILRRFGSRSATARNLAGLVGPGSTAVDDAMIDRVHTLLSRPGNRAAFVNFANTAQPDRTPELRSLDVPTLVLTSDLARGQRFAADILGSTEVTLTGVGHLMPAEAPARVADEIVTFATARGLIGTDE